MFGLTAIECFVAIVIIYTILYWITPRKGIWLPLLFFVLLISYLAFRVEPNDTDDLTRYFMQLDYLRDYGYDYLRRCIEENANQSNWGTYKTCAYYFYFISKLPDNHWMPAITIFISYGLMFLVMYKAANHFNISKTYLYLGTMFFISTYWFYDTYSGVRNGLTFAVIFGCAYYHLVERKRIPLCYLGYFLACFLHSSGIMLVTLVILTELTLNNSGKFINFMMIFGLIAGGALMQFLSTKTDNTFVQTIAGLAEKHQADDDVLYTDTNFLVNITVLMVVAIIVFYYSVYVLNSEYSSGIKRLYKFSSIVMYFLVGCIFSELIFMRLARWILPILGALFIMIGMQLRKNYIEDKGSSYLRFFAPINQRLRYNLRSFFNMFVLGYTGVHFWYLCEGSSLCWLHF